MGRVAEYSVQLSGHLFDWSGYLFCQGDYLFGLLRPHIFRLE